MGPGRRRAVLLAMCLAVTVVVASMSSLNLALPGIGLELGASQSELQWMVDGYTLLLAALVLPAGALGDRFGRQRLMVIGLTVLLATLVYGPVADTPLQLVLSRLLGGLGAAMVFPGTLSTITAVMPADQRGKAIGLWAGSGTLGGVAGIIVAGVLVESYWWGSVFLASAAVALVTLVLTALAVPNTADPDHAHLDPAGSVLAAVAAGGIVFGATEGPVRGWTDTLTLAGLMFGLVALTGFAVWELRSPRPLLDVRLFRHRGFASGSVVVATEFFAMIGLLFLGGQYLTFVRGYGPLDTGLGIAPMGLLMIPAALLAAPLAVRYGRGRIGGLGLAVMVPGLALLATMDTASGYWVMAVGIAVMGAGFGLSIAPATAAIVSALPAAKQGVASAMNDVAREFGAALGVAVIGSAFNGVYRGAISTAAVPPQVLPVARDSIGAALAVAAGLGPQGLPMAGAVRNAFMDGWVAAMAVTAAIVAVAAAIVLLWTPASADVDMLDPMIDPTDDRTPTHPPATIREAL